MAAYASTVTLTFPTPIKINKYLWVLTGKIDVTNYNQTGAEITAISGEFNKVIRIICDGISDNMYLTRWNTTDKCVHAFYPFYAYANSIVAGANNSLVKISTTGPSEVGGTGTAYGQPAVEVEDNVDVGEVNFIAYGSR